MRRDRPARWAGDLAALALAPIAPKGFAWRRPRHTLKARQDAAAVEASRQHLADLKTQAAAGAIDLVFLDESEALTHPIWRAAGPGADRNCASKRPVRRKSGRCSAPLIRCAVSFSCMPAPPSVPPTLSPCSTSLAPPTAPPNEPDPWSRFSTTGRSTPAS